MMQRANLRAKILEKVIDDTLLMNWERYEYMFGEKDTRETFKADLEQISSGLVLNPFHIFALKIKDEYVKEYLAGVLNIDPFPSEEILQTVKHLLSVKCKARAIVSTFFLANLVKLLELMNESDEIAVEILERDDDYLLRLRTKNIDVVLSPLNKEKINLEWLEGEQYVQEEEHGES